jgi:uroporphyrinogen III methyltransferase/synthase
LLKNLKRRGRKSSSDICRERADSRMKNMPLSGKKIAVTRNREQAGKLVEMLASRGAEVIEFPTIEIRPLDDLFGLEKAMSEIESFHWIFLTSRNAVEIFFDRLELIGIERKRLAGISFAVVGPATARCLESYGIKPALVPDEFVAEGLLDASAGTGVSGKRVLLPSAAGAREVLAEGLSDLGADVVRINIYHSVKPESVPDERVRAVKEADIITFTSSSTAENLFSLVPDIAAIYACIGPATADTVKKCGRQAHIVAGEYTLDGLVEAIVDYYS